MCIGGGPVGPQKYSGGSSSGSTMGDDKQRDSEGNDFHSLDYHKKLRADANAREQPSESNRPRMRGGSAPRASLLTRTIDSIFPKG